MFASTTLHKKLQEVTENDPFGELLLLLKPTLSERERPSQEYQSAGSPPVLHKHTAKRGLETFNTNSTRLCRYRRKQMSRFLDSKKNGKP